MASRPFISLLATAALGCAATAPRSGGVIAPPATVARPGPEPWSGCDTPGRERCGSEPNNSQAVRDMLRLACVEDCSQHWMESSGVVAAADRPVSARRAELGKVQATLLSCFASCDERQVDFDLANMPPGVQPCTKGKTSPLDSACLEYACQIYGDHEYMLPSAIRRGESCEVPATKQPGTCFAGSCVPAWAHAEACSAFAIRATAIDWLFSLKGEQLCKKPGSTVVCSPRPLGRASRSSLLEWLSCEELRGELNPPAVPWGHWPISLTQGEK